MIVFRLVSTVLLDAEYANQVELDGMNDWPGLGRQFAQLPSLRMSSYAGMVRNSTNFGERIKSRISCADFR
jgi:hypothetical protein